MYSYPTWPEASPAAWDAVAAAQAQLEAAAKQRTAAVQPQLAKVLAAFQAEKLGSHHFASVNGYGHNDQGRDTLDRVFARVLGAERAAVRLQFVSGTHAIAAALFGVLRPGDRLLSITGRPYDTLEEVIGIRGSGQGSLAEFGIQYSELALTGEGHVDELGLSDALSLPTRMVLIQRSCGYSWRPSLSVAQIGRLVEQLKTIQPGVLVFVDNCYGELVEFEEPTAVGADLIAGSLIKNLGGTIVPSGAYVAGVAELVEQACCRLTAPGIGSAGGSGFDLHRLLFQGLFLAPQMVAEALINADLIAQVFSNQALEVQPLAGAARSDVIQAVKFGDPRALQVVCNAFQSCSPVESYLKPVPAPMPGYASELLMAGGSFVDGSTSEFSADAPLREPYVLFSQGGTHRSHGALALAAALTSWWALAPN
ncbi:methionine gamma-lyase family protein [Synechococcus sp. UW140]|uniref:methionine gamma-lyase family protein n=1 Tax=Synechococcus TaxID=1129 RepID=UPI0031377AB5